MYGEWLNQLDLRFGKVLRFGRLRAVGTLDLNYALNASPVLVVNDTFTRWQQPESILNARFAKVGLWLNF